MSEKQLQQVTGGCLCGAVQFEINGAVSSFHLCYCNRCRHNTGSAHAANIFAKPEALRWLKGEEKIQRFELPQAKSFAKQFCRECGAPVPYINRSGAFLVIPAGSIDTPFDFASDDRIFVAEQAKWTECIATLPTFDSYPDQF
ncbi:GFA family protein [Pseudoalteromonas fenneropenaei]|uniref:GFA family protein n=1 Tax=Pseudoalteromonas fenneropenaei TaxID=1737459 RepID=A0ABV7CJC9_9GAMM